MKRLAPVLAAGAALLAGAAQAQPASWSAPGEPLQIGGNLYYVGTEGIAAFLITTPEGHILIDGAMPTSAPLIEASIRKVGFDPKDVKILLNTHAHFDHSGGLAQLKADTGATLIASAADRPALESGEYVGSEEVAAFDFPPVKVDRVIGDGETVELGGVALTAHLTPGHSPGCTTWTFPVQIAGRTRQALLYCSTSVAANRLVSKDEGPQYPGIVEDYQASFEKLGQMKADVFLAPHAEQFGLTKKRERLAAGDAEAFVDPTELPAVVAASKAAFETALKTQKETAR
ncbi:MAG: subclass B3 metallo-beta-lactamase [Phenylobacterium sp.]|uniref:subclass B3 metallo-beta-lactamase n=1 Tax=Phenylobacterium sp. TaxID=1871053 RepID=UPI001830A2E1|nr:subclass B3 metallo-beta-lactamase [Phenylobacterium sp.]MBA4792138.1 subclass B3 metallo-beta-lactamase [Phenylobacterium sp.]